MNVNTNKDSDLNNYKNGSNWNNSTNFNWINPNSIWNGTVLPNNSNSTWNGSVSPYEVSSSLMTINLANMTFLVNQLIDYDMTARTLWVNFVPYNITAVVNYTNTPNMWANLNETGI